MLVRKSNDNSEFNVVTTWMMMFLFCVLYAMMSRNGVQAASLTDLINLALQDSRDDMT